MIAERGAQLTINGDLTNDHIQPWPIDIHDGLAGSRADHHEADVFLGVDDLRPVYDAAPEQGGLTRADHERLLALFAPIDADFSGDHVQNAVVVRVGVPLAGNVARGHPRHADPEAIRLIRRLPGLTRCVRAFGEIGFAKIDDVVGKQALAHVSLQATGRCFASGE